jgi:hypothetical protein
MHPDQGGLLAGEWRTVLKPEYVEPFLISTQILRSAGLVYDAVYSGTSEEHTASIFTVGIEGIGLLRSFGSCMLDYIVP